MLLRAATLELEDAEINELVEHTEGWASRPLPDRSRRARRERRARRARRPLGHRGRPLPRRLLPLGVPLAARSRPADVPSPDLRARIDERPALRRRPRPDRLGLGARGARAGEPVRRPARPPPQLVPLPPSVPRAAAARARGARARAGAGAQPARRRLVRGAGRPRVDARLLARGRQQGERRSHPQLDRDARLRDRAGGRGRVVARALRRRDARPATRRSRSRARGSTRCAAGPTRPRRGWRPRSAAPLERRPVRRRPASRSFAPRCATKGRSGC